MNVRAALVVVSLAGACAHTETAAPGNVVDPVAAALADLCAERTEASCVRALAAASALATSTPTTPVRQPLAVNTAVVLAAAEVRQGALRSAHVVGEVVAGDVVTVHSCSTTVVERVCDISDANNLRGVVREDVLGTRADVLAARVGTALASLAAQHTSNDAVDDLLPLVEEALEANELHRRVSAFDTAVANTRAPAPLRMGLVGRHVVIGAVADLPHDDEQVYALCADGPRQVPAHVAIAAAPTASWPAAYAVTITVDCEAKVVIAAPAATVVTNTNTLELGEQTRALFLRDAHGVRTARYGLGLQRSRWPVQVHGAIEATIDVDNNSTVDAVVSAQLFDLPVTVWEVVTSNSAALVSVAQLVEVTEERSQRR